MALLAAPGGLPVDLDLGRGQRWQVSDLGMRLTGRAGVDSRTRGSQGVFGEGRQAGGGRRPENPASPHSAPQLLGFPEEGLEDALRGPRERMGDASAARPVTCSDPF